MRTVLAAVLALLATITVGEAAGTFSNLPAANEPIGSAQTAPGTGPTYVPMDQGTGCPNGSTCNTVQADALRLGQPIQTNCTAIPSPWQYQGCIDTTLNPPEQKIFIGTTWWPVSILDPNAGPSPIFGPLLGNLTFAGNLTYTGYQNYTYTHVYGSNTTPVAADISVSYTANYSGTCHIAGNCNAQVWTFNDNVLVPTPFGGTVVYQGIQHNIAATSTGNHVTTEWVTLVNGSANPCCNNTVQADYGSIFARTTATANLAGIGLGANQVAGQIQTMGLLANTLPAATNLVAVNPLELDVQMQTGSSAYEKVALLIVQIPGDTVMGATVDTGIQFAAAGGTPGWRQGICFGCNTSAPVIATTGTVMGGTDVETVTNLLSFPSWTVSGNYFQFHNFLLTGLGQMTLSTPTAGTSGPALSVQSNSANNHGGLVQLFNNGAGVPSPSKYLGVDIAGNFELVNNAFASALLQISDLGAVNIPGTLAVTGASALHNVTATGTLGVTGAATINGELTVQIAAASSAPSLSVQGGRTGGAGGGVVQLFNNTAAAPTPSKWFQVDSAGNFELVNNAFSSSILTISDAGAVAMFGNTSVTGTFGATGNVTFNAGLGVTGLVSAGSLTVSGNSVFTGFVNSTLFEASGTPGVTCGPGSPTAAFQSAVGIVIHC